MERLQKVIAASGYTSRRKAEELIVAGKVLVNGKKVTTLGTKVSGDDEITINGVSLAREEKVYFLLYKPDRTISAVSDDKKRTTVVDLINTNYRIYPVGRLDYDTTGLLILTNDGELSNILMSPKNEVIKTYIARLNKILTIEDLQKLKSGIVIDNRKCQPIRVKLKSKNKEKNTCVVEISIVEGRNHIVKNVFSSLGYKVIKLKRTEYGFLNLNNLGMGEYRKLTIKEVKKLYGYKRYED